MQAEYRHREQLMSKIGNGTAIFRSAPMAVMHNDVEYTFRQDSDFFYLTKSAVSPYLTKDAI